jgi:L-aspartate oxidase
MERTQHPNVYLDLSHLDPVMVRERFPGINRVCRSFGLNITKDLIPVRPGAHYMVGGITVDLKGRTTIPNLWGAGEVTSSGLHGANRLASNSLIEGLVYGTLCARGATENARRIHDDLRALPLKFQMDGELSTDLDVEDVTNSLRSLMVRKMGIVRERARLREAERDVEFWCRYVLNREFNSREGWELQNLLTIARLMIDAAIKREESRGTHFRSDFPKRDDEHWRSRTTSPQRDESEAMSGLFG